MCIIDYDRKNVNSKLEKIYILSTNIVTFPRIWLLNHKKLIVIDENKNMWLNMAVRRHLLW